MEFSENKLLLDAHLSQGVFFCCFFLTRPIREAVNFSHALIQLSPSLCIFVCSLCFIYCNVNFTLRGWIMHALT